MEGKEKTLVVSTEGLSKNSRSTSLGSYLRRIWRYRVFIIEDARHRAFRSTEGYYMWQAWLILAPLLEAGMYGFLFGYVFNASRGIDNFTTYLLVGLTVFTVITRLTGAGSGLIQSNLKLIRTFEFPAAVVASSQALRSILDSLPGVVFGFVVAIFFQATNGGLFWTTSLLLPILILAAMFGTGFMFQIAAATAIVPDVKSLVNLLLRGWMFFSCIFYPISRFNEVPWLRALAQWNPAYRYILASRQVVMDGKMVSGHDWLIMLLWSIGAVMLGIIMLWICERRVNELA